MLTSPAFFERRNAFNETVRQLELVFPNDIDALLVDPPDSRSNADDARQIGSAGFKPVGHDFRHGFKIAGAARVAGVQSENFVGKIAREQDSTDSLRAEQALVTCEAYGVDGQNARGLSRVNGIPNAPRATYLRDLADRRDCAAYVARVRGQDELCPRSNESLDFARVKIDFRRACRFPECNAPSRQLH